MRSWGTWMVALAVLLAGCASVPTVGPVARVSADPERINPGVEIAPAPPGRDATPSEVVEGFLHAMASWQPDYRLARAYLTPEADAVWNPDIGVRVYAEGNPVVASEEGARLAAPVVGTLDHTGAYRQSTGQLDHDFGLVQADDGQWRIANPPEGLIISEYLFTSAFARVVVYFFAPGRQWLVPDPRFFPRGPSAIEGAVRAVVSQPSSWLAAGLDHEVPLVSLEGVRVDGMGVAHITLRRVGPDLDEEGRRQLLTRLVWTLRPFENVVGVQVGWVGEDPWQLPGLVTTVPTGAFPEADPQDRQTSRQLYAVVDGQVVRAIEGPTTLDSIPVAPGVDGVSHAAVRPDALQVAAVTAERAELVVAPLSQPGLETVATGVGLRRPHYSRQGELWVVDDSGAVSAVLPDGRQVLVPVTGLGDSRIRALRLSPDGVRIALVLEQPGGVGSVALGLVARGSGSELSVQGVRELSVSESAVARRSVRDVGWRSSDTLLVLVSDGRATTVMALAQDGSLLAPIGPTGEEDLLELAVAPGVPAMVRTSAGTVLRYNADFRWSVQATTATSVFYPG